jgi:hypothetical protein
VCVAVASSHNQARAVNLVINGGFETHDFTGWTQTNADPFNSAVICGGGGALGSSCFAEFGLDSSVIGISQNLTTIPGASYVVDFWFFHFSGTPSSFVATFDGNTLLSLTNPTTAPFTEFSFVVTAAGTTATLAFAFHDDPGVLLLDEVSVSQTPIPAALPLFVSGLGALGLIGWRRKKKAALAAFGAKLASIRATAGASASVFAIIALFGGTPAAAITKTYEVADIGPDFALSGSIVTDGQFGVLNQSNIQDWNLTVTFFSHPDVAQLTGPLSGNNAFFW